MEQGNRLEHISIIPQKHRTPAPIYERLQFEVENIISFIADKRSIPALIDLLDDNEYEVRWIAAEGLIRVGRKSIIPILELIRDGKQFRYPRKVHHVLENLLARKEKRELHHLLATLDSYPYILETATLQASVALKNFMQGN